MCVKLPSGDLNHSPYSSHLTNIYTCRVTIASRVCGGLPIYLMLKFDYKCGGLPIYLMLKFDYK